MNIPNIFDWFQRKPQKYEAPWLILGKGPSLSLYTPSLASEYSIITLNDVIRSVSSTDLAHFIDFEAFVRCTDAISRNPNVMVVMPWYPHFNCKVGTADLASLSVRNPLLLRLIAEGRLCWYDLITSPIRNGHHPVVSVSFFSSEAVLDLLASAGVRRIRSLGIDGGKVYSNDFSDLIDISLLANGLKTFDRQFESFAKVIVRTGVDYAPLNMETPINIYVASSISEALPVKVLEYSIKQYASSTVTVTPLYEVNIPIPKPRAPENQQRTPFSFQRFLIPQASGYVGRAIYLDSDMLVFRDIVNLWRRPFGSANVLSAYSASITGRRPQYSVMLMNCSQLNWNIKEIVDQLDTGKLSYEELMYEFKLAKTRADIEADWNSLETFKEGKTALLHYTDMNIQPWVSCLNPLGYLWVRVLRQAMQNGLITRTFVEKQINQGYLRPSLLYQLDHNIDDSFLLPKSALALDVNFTPPYRSLGKHRTSSWSSYLHWLRASVRTRFHDSKIYQIERRILNRLKL